jgi:DNA-binding response OmpR family regulator
VSAQPRVRIVGDGGTSQVLVDKQPLPGVRSILWRSENGGTATVELQGVGIDSFAVPVIQAADREVLRVHDLEVDRLRHRVLLRGEDIRLSKLEFALLAYLAAEPTRVFTKREILEAVWGYGEYQSRTLTSHTSRLRRKLSGTPREYVQTINGVGFRLTNEEPA